MEWEQKFQKDVVDQEEEKRKKVLKDIRDSKKPMQREDLEAHARKYQEIVDKKKEETEQKFQKLHEASVEYAQKYKTRAYEMISLQEQEERERKAEEEMRRKAMLEKK